MLEILKMLPLELWLQLGMVQAGYGEDADAAMAKKDYVTALKKYRLAAAKENAYAQYKIGNRYGVGLGVKKISPKRHVGTNWLRCKEMQMRN